MPNWSLVSYNDRDIKTKEDIIWVAEEVLKAYKSGNVEMKDKMALSFLETYVKEYGDLPLPIPIDSRFEILDL